MILSCRKLKLCDCRRLKLTVKGGGGIVLCACVSLRKKYFKVQGL